MEHINKDFVGWFTFSRLYKDMVDKFPSGSTFVEVGVYHGKSFSYLVIEGLNSGKQFTMVGLDSFTFENQLQTFQENMQPIINNFEVIIDQSDSADKYFEDESVDFCFIDACHLYENVKADILAWWPKIKRGGVIAGHDLCQEHPGIYQALNEMWGDNYSKEYLDELCWLKYKE